MKNSSKSKVTNLTVTALLCAIIAVAAFIPIRTLGLEITLCMVPVAVGAAIYGPVTGAVLGGVFGTVSFIQCFGYSPFGAALLSVNPLWTFLLCVPTRVLAGWLPGLISSAMKKAKRDKKAPVLACPVACLTAPVFNTLFFMSALCLFFYKTDFITGFVETLGATNPVIFVLLFVGINGLVEIAAGFVVATPVSAALMRMLHPNREKISSSQTEDFSEDSIEI